MLDPTQKIRLIGWLRTAFSNGPHRSDKPLTATLGLVDFTVHVSNHALKLSGSPVRIAIAPYDPRLGPSAVKGVSVVTATTETVIPITILVSRVIVRDSLVLLEGRDGAVRLMEAIMHEVHLATGGECTGVPG